jgi:outer membrane protein assembly factor BamD (BamD/ComL family)
MTEREDEQFFGREEAIAQNVKDGRVDLALERYDDYVSMRHAKPLPPWAQIEIAGELYRRGDYEGALRAYRRYLASYPTGPDAPEAKFRLGIILSRHMREYFRAREYLVEAVMEHTDSSIVDFARNELQRIEALL